MQLKSVVVDWDQSDRIESFCSCLKSLAHAKHEACMSVHTVQYLPTWFDCYECAHNIAGMSVHKVQYLPTNVIMYRFICCHTGFGKKVELN